MTGGRDGIGIPMGVGLRVLTHVSSHVVGMCNGRLPSRDIDDFDRVESQRPGALSRGFFHHVELDDQRFDVVYRHTGVDDYHRRVLYVNGSTALLANTCEVVHSHHSTIPRVCYA